MGKQNNQQVTVVSGSKVLVVLGVLHLLIAFGIAGVNLYFRFTDMHRADGYEYAEGVIIKREEKAHYIGARKSTDTWITVQYTPKGSDKKKTHSDTDFSYGFLYTGTPVRVYYKGDDPRDIFFARYDWIVRDYLPADKSYNIPLIVAGILLIIGIYYLADNKKPKKGSAQAQPEFTVDPATGMVYSENLHQLARMSNYKRSWMGFWIAGSLGFTAFTAMGVAMIIVALNDPKVEPSSKSSMIIAAAFFIFLGSGFIPLIITTIMRQNRNKRLFIKAFMADEATAVYSDRAKAAGILWKHVNHYMEKETLWSRYKLEYSRFWLERYKDKLEKCR